MRWDEKFGWIGFFEQVFREQCGIGGVGFFIDLYKMFVIIWEYNKASKYFP